MLTTSNQMVNQRGRVFGDEMIAAAVVDRLLHHSQTLVIQADSFRLGQKKLAGLLGSSKTQPALNILRGSVLVARRGQVLVAFDRRIPSPSVGNPDVGSHAPQSQFR